MPPLAFSSAVRASLLRFLARPALLFCTARAQNITVYSSGTVERGTTRQLSAYVPLSPNTVTWAVNGVTGGDATFGTVSPTGLYQAPAIIPANNIVAVRRRAPLSRRSSARLR